MTRHLGRLVHAALIVALLWVLGVDSDTLLAAPVAVGSRRQLRFGGRVWSFNTPRGVRTVISKETDPLWIRADWAYVEVAREHELGRRSRHSRHARGGIDRARRDARLSPPERHRLGLVVSS